MRQHLFYFALLFLFCQQGRLKAEDDTATAIRLLQPFNTMIGTWKGYGVPEGTAAERNQGQWTESISCAWQFQKKDAAIILDFVQGKHLKRGELRPILPTKRYRLKITTTTKTEIVFEGELKNKVLVLERVDPEKKESQKLVFTLLHSNRMLYRYEVKSVEKSFYNKRYQVGATKDGEPLVTQGINERECIVSGGSGTSTVTFQGKTYYVCCSGCRDAFLENPTRFVKEFEKRKAEFEKKMNSK